MFIYINLLLAILCFVICYFSFRQKGYLFNNAFIYSSKQEREKMDKKPHYKQSAIIFCGLGVLFSLLVAEAITHIIWLYWIACLVGILVLIYAIVSSIMIEKQISSKK